MNRLPRKALHLSFYILFVGFSAQAQTVTVTNNNPARAYPQFVVGDPWTVQITGGGAYQTVTTHAVHNGSDLGTSSNGYTDASGGYTTSGNIDGSTVGTWSETVYLGGVAIVPNIEFTVAEPEVCYFSPSGNGSNFSPMTGYDTYMESGYSYPTPAGGQTMTHSRTNGPCTLSFAYASTGSYVSASYEESHYPAVGVDWTIEDSITSLPAVGRCNVFTNGDIGCYYNYPVYESGNVQTVFQHPDTGAYFWVTSYYSYVAHCSYPELGIF